MQNMPKKKRSASSLRQQALEKENFRLLRKIATLEAKLVSARNELLLRPPYEEQRPMISIEAYNKAISNLTPPVDLKTPKLK